jgi:hypothetical protein
MEQTSMVPPCWLTILREIGLTPAISAQRCWLDQLDHDANLRRADLVVQLVQEVQADQAIDVIVAEVEHVDVEAGPRIAERGELVDGEDVALFRADGGAHASSLDPIACAVTEQVRKLGAHRGHGGAGIESEACSRCPERSGDDALNEDQAAFSGEGCLKPRYRRPDTDAAT